MVYAAAMVVVYPLGIPALYAYILFVKHGKEMRLLKSIEMKRATLTEDARAASELSAARLCASSTSPAAKTSAADPSGARDTGEENDEPTMGLQLRLAHLEREEELLRAELPDYVQKLVLGCTHAGSQTLECSHTHSAPCSSLPLL